MAAKLGLFTKRIVLLDTTNILLGAENLASSKFHHTHVWGIYKVLVANTLNSLILAKFFSIVHYQRVWTFSRSFGYVQTWCVRPESRELSIMGC